MVREIAWRSGHGVFLARRVAGRDNLRAHVAACEQSACIADGGALDAGQTFDAPLQFVQKHIELRFLRNIAQFGTDVDDLEMMRIESVIHCQQIAQTEEEACAPDNQQESECHLDSKEGPPQNQAAGRRASAVERGRRLGCRGAPCRNQPENDCRAGGNGCAEKQHSRVHGKREADGLHFLREHRDERGRGDLRDCPTQAARGERKQEAFREKLAHDTRAIGAQRYAHGNFRRAGITARQQQAGDIGARDQQHSRAGAQHNPEGTRERDLEIRIPGRCGMDQQRALAVLLLHGCRSQGKTLDHVLLVCTKDGIETGLQSRQRRAPGERRPKMRNQPHMGSSSAALLYIMAGIQMFTNFPGSTPKKPLRATPTMLRL